MNNYETYHIHKENNKENLAQKYSITKNIIMIYQINIQHHRLCLHIYTVLCMTSQRQFHIYIQYTYLPLLHAIQMTPITFSTAHHSTPHTTTSISTFSTFCSVHICYCVLLAGCCSVYNRFITQ